MERKEKKRKQNQNEIGKPISDYSMKMKWRNKIEKNIRDTVTSLGVQFMFFVMLLDVGKASPNWLQTRVEITAMNVINRRKKVSKFQNKNKNFDKRRHFQP